MIQRRTLLLASTAALTGCGLTLTAIASDVQLVATGVQALAPLLGPLGVPAATIAQVVALAADVAAHVTSVGSVISSLTPPSNVAAIVTDVNAIATLVEPFILNNTIASNQVSEILTALRALLPVISAVAGVPVPVGTLGSVMTPDDARAVLKSL